MEQAKISSEQFARRLGKIQSIWNSDSEFNTIGVLLGKEDPRSSSIKTSALHIYLLGYEFVDSLFFFTRKSVFIIASQKKFNYLQNFQKDIPQYQFHFLTKNATNDDHFEFVKKTVKNETNQQIKLGLLIKEKHFSPLADELAKNFPTPFDLNPLISNLLSEKEPSEFQLIYKSIQLSTLLMQKLIDEIEKNIDEGIKESHEKISRKVEAYLSSNDLKLLVTKKIGDISLCDWSFSPVIQSGGVYDVRPQAVSDSRDLKYDTILCSIGAKYHEYNSNLVRTLFINPSDDQKKAYQASLDLLNIVISLMKPGKKLCDVHKESMEYFQQRYPELSQYVSPVLGYGQGLEFRESLLQISNTNQTSVSANQCYSIDISLCHMSNNNQQYTIHIVQPFMAQSLPNTPSIIYQDISYQLDLTPPVSVIQPRTRGTVLSVQDQDNRRKEHQKLLQKKKQDEMEKRLQDGGLQKQERKQQIFKVDSIQAYLQPQSIQKRGEIVVDLKAGAVILPVAGEMLAFHISVIKNVSKHDEGNTSSIRFNFYVPGSGVNQTNMVFPTYQNAPIYIRELTFRSHDVRKLNENLKKIKDLQKNMKLKEQEDKNRDELAVIETLQTIKGKRPVLQDLKMRPNISGRKTNGVLEAHINGLKYSSTKNETIIINYENIKHAFFQSSDQEMIVLLHFNLHQPLLIGKKKSHDIQFYTEAGIQTEDLDFKRRNQTEYEEIEQEEREKAQRKRLNKEFELFTKAVEAQAKEKVIFEKPYRELGFYGTPNRSQVFIMPTVNCLVNLIEVPFFIMPIDEIEIAHFERIQFGLKNFDIALINKNYDKPVSRISAIPTSYLEPLRTWLDKMDILYSETNKNLAWDVVINQIKDDFENFVQDGGWSFLQEEEKSNVKFLFQSEESEEESEFTVSQESEEGSSDEDSDEEFDEEEDEESDSEFDEEGYILIQEELSEEGLSWDELEEMTKKCKIIIQEEQKREMEKAKGKRR